MAECKECGGYARVGEELCRVCQREERQAYLEEAEEGERKRLPVDEYLRRRAKGRVNPKAKKKNPGAAWHQKEYDKARERAVTTPRESVRQRYLRGLSDAHAKSIKEAKKMGMNPPKGAVEIYDKILRIEAQKGNKGVYPKEKFYHDFSKNTKAKIFGLPDGSILIKGKKRLWSGIEQGKGED